MFNIIRPHTTLHGIHSQVIERSGGVVFLEQLAPILNPREGPLRLSRGGVADSSAVTDETLVLRLLSNLRGLPEVRFAMPLLCNRMQHAVFVRGANCS